MLSGFGAFNLIEGSINHHLLEIHHVNETAPPDDWNWWDLGFLTWGAAMVFVGILLLRHGATQTTPHRQYSRGEMGLNLRSYLWRGADPLADCQKAIRSLT